MKANSPKRKVFQDALDLLAEDPVQDTSVAVNGIVSIPVEEIHPFYDHPFRLYEGDRLEDMGTEHQGVWCAESGDREEGCKGV